MELEVLTHWTDFVFLFVFLPMINVVVVMMVVLVPR